MALAGVPRLPCIVQTKGYKKDASIKIEDVEKLFAETGKAKYVKICRVAGSKLSERSGVEWGGVWGVVFYRPPFVFMRRWSYGEALAQKSPVHYRM